jgi:hypothetical protein
VTANRDTARTGCLLVTWLEALSSEADLQATSEGSGVVNTSQSTRSGSSSTTSSVASTSPERPTTQSPSTSTGTDSEDLARQDPPRDDFSFAVQGSCTDPRFLDLTLDPSDRPTGTLWGDAWQANLGPVLGRCASGRWWLSQWSIEDSHGHGPTHLLNVTIPVQVIYRTADAAALPSHARALFDAWDMKTRTSLR